MQTTGARERRLIRREQLIKLGRLLEMRYKPAELGREIGVSADTVYRTYIPAGAPHERDAQGNIWIVGTHFREWAFTEVGYHKRAKHPLQPGEAWCCKCNKPVMILKPKIKAVNQHIHLIQGRCSICGGKVNRAAANKDLPG